MMRLLVRIARMISRRFFDYVFNTLITVFLGRGATARRTKRGLRWFRRFTRF